MQTTLTQPAIALALLYAGGLLGVLYDVFRIPRRIFYRRFLVNLFDLLFISAACIITACSFLFITAGEVRPFELVLYAAGFALEQISVSYFFFRFWHTLKERLQRRK